MDSRCRVVNWEYSYGRNMEGEGFCNNTVLDGSSVGYQNLPWNSFFHLQSLMNLRHSAMPRSAYLSNLLQLLLRAL